VQRLTDLVGEPQQGLPDLVPLPTQVVELVLDGEQPPCGDRSRGVAVLPGALLLEGEPGSGLAGQPVALRGSSATHLLGLPPCPVEGVGRLHPVADHALAQLLHHRHGGIAEQLGLLHPGLGLQARVGNDPVGLLGGGFEDLGGLVGGQPEDLADPLRDGREVRARRGGRRLPAELSELSGADGEPREQVVPGPAGGCQLVLDPAHVVVDLHAVVAVHARAEHRPGVQQPVDAPGPAALRERRPDVVVGPRLGSIL
jgi:hypothetical protein